MSEIKIPNIKPNSNAYKSGESKEKEKMKPVVKKENIVSVKKPITRKLTDKFLETDIKEAKEYFISDILIPGIKDTVLDILSMLLTGDSYDRRGRRYSNSRYSSYSSYYRGGRRRERDRRGRRYEEDRYESKNNLSYRDVIVKDVRDAEDIVRQLHNRIDIDGSASVADLFALIDVSCPYTDNNYGWTRCSQIDIKKVSGGYLIDVDEARYLD